MKSKRKPNSGALGASWSSPVDHRKVILVKFSSVGMQLLSGGIPAI